MRPLNLVLWVSEATAIDHVPRARVRFTSDDHDGLTVTVEANPLERRVLPFRADRARRRLRNRIHEQAVALVDPPDCDRWARAECGP